MIVQRNGCPHGRGQRRWWEWYPVCAMAVSKTPRRPLPTKEELPAQPDLAARRKLLEQILKLSKTIEEERGILSESYLLIREDRER
jgi:hypothetical protein